MAPARPAPARRKADEFLKECIREHRAAGVERLPPLRHLAARAGVCYPTMQRAIARCVRDGTLSARQGSAVHIGPPADKPLPARVIEDRSTILHRRLRLELLSGRIDDIRRTYRTNTYELGFEGDPEVIRKALAKDFVLSDERISQGINLVQYQIMQLRLCTIGLQSIEALQTTKNLNIW